MTPRRSTATPDAAPAATTHEQSRARGAPAEHATPPIVSAIGASIELRNGLRLLDDAHVEVRGGELLAIIGPSGSGKTTLLETLAGVRTPTSGRLEVSSDSVPFGYVPQDDIVHRELTVESTLRYAARLRLPSGTSSDATEVVVERTLRLLGLAGRRSVTVSSLSGGQRKRVSIATELVVRPNICLLDEPTAGLDPDAASSLMELLREVADAGTAIVMTTHNLADLRVADRLIVMGEGGRIVSDGAPSDGDAHLPMPVVHAVRQPAASRAGASSMPATAHSAALDADVPAHAGRRSRREQSVVLARRNAELVLRNRMSLAIMAGSPLLVVAMFAVLFPAGVFGPSADRTAATSLIYWLAFAGFFFGLTFGLLQICTELPIVRRERLVTIDLGPYLIAKFVVLLPVLGVVNLAMLVTLATIDRLPSLSARDAATVWTLLWLDAIAGLALGLLASASVANPAQAALALPMLCFPAVLFSGAVLPVSSMASAGRTIAALMSDRWAYEAVARSLHVADVAPGAHPRLAVDEALVGSIGHHAWAMVALALVFAGAARVVLARRTR